MKPDFDFARLDRWKLQAGILSLALALVFGGGCGKKSVPPPVASTSPSDSASTVDSPAVTPPANRVQSSAPSVSANPNGPTQLQLLNRALLGWKIKNHRQPQTFEDFASSAGFQIPDPPTGKKYSLKSGFIILANAN